MKNINNKKLIAFIGIIFFLSSLNINSFLHAQKPFLENNTENLITGIDVGELSKKHLSGFDLIRKRAKWNYGREYVFKNIQDNNIVFLTIGVYPSVEYAMKIINNYLKGISIKMVEDQIKTFDIGDEFWWWAPSMDSMDVSNIIFIRQNTLIILSKINNIRLDSLAKTIDEGIKNGDSFVKRSEIIQFPVINSISKDKSIVQLNEKIKLSVDAFDPNNEPLEYQSLPGLRRSRKDPENIFTFEVSANRFPDSTKTCTVKMVVINKSNLVSPMFEVDIQYVD